MDTSLLDDKAQVLEWERCAASPLYFARTYGWVENVDEGAWVRFDLWPAQSWVLTQYMQHRLLVVLKARQLGLTWVSLLYALWLMLFRPAAAVGIFSRTEPDAQDLLDRRLKGMYERLPTWMQARAIEEDNKGRWQLSNGSLCMAFATTGGRSYTFRFVMADEADFQPDLASLMTATKPTIDAGGQMLLLSTSNKGDPGSRFKQIYRGARQGANDWRGIFLPWWSRPGRTRAWYEAQRRDSLVNTTSLDDVHQEYPATDTEALAPRTLDKRIPAPWIEACYRGLDPLTTAPERVQPPALAQLEIYHWPELGRRYVLGADPAEGNPTSDDSALTVLDEETGQECAALAGKFQPATFGGHIDAVGTFFNKACIMVERNNHGHAVLLWLHDNSRLRVLDGHDGNPGWHSTSRGKTMMYDSLAEAFQAEDITLHSFATYMQVAGIEGRSLRAPEGERDDRADSLALANVGREYVGKSGRKKAKIV